MRFQSLCALIGASMLVGVAGCDEVSFPTPVAEEFQAVLSGANEVPAVTTGATGTALFAVTLDTFLSYRIDVATIDSTTVAHIHEGAAGVPGAAIVTLFVGPTTCTSSTAQSPSCRLDFIGPLAQGQVRPSQLFSQLPAGYGADTVARFDSLLVLMRTGKAYVNVHTRANAGGEIRGQIQLQ